jgi:hypothetical protein
MITRLPKWAELTFASHCAAAGALAHPPEEDQNGWDYLVEFPQQTHPGPADTHPPAKSAYVQIKSVRQRRLTSRVTLSNALKAAQSTQPWFLVLVFVDKKTMSAEIYAIHVWEDFIRRALKAVRVAENAGKPLNRCTLSVTFSAINRHDGDGDLVPWMQGVIAAHEPDYQQKKQKLYQAVGYEDGTGIGKCTIGASSLDELANNVLGLGSGLSLSEFSFTSSRFGVVSPKPDVDYSGEGHIFITPNPVDTCEVRLRANDALYSLKGQVFALGEPLLPRGERRVRFSAECLAIVVATDSLEVKSFNARLDPDSKRALHILEAFAALKDCCQTGTQVDLQVWARGQRVIGGTGSPNDKPLGSVSWGRLAVAMRKLRGLLVGNEDSVKVTLKEAVKGGQRLAVFTETINAPSLRLEFEPTEETPPKIDSLVFYSFAEVGDFLFFALFESELIKETPIGSRRQLDFDAPKLIDSYALENPTPQQKEQMEKDYQQYLETREQQGHPAGIGEILAFSQATMTQPKAA